MLKERTVSYRSLYLDPNNPRLVVGFVGGATVADEEVSKVQSKLEQRFGIPSERESQRELDEMLGDSSDGPIDEFFSIKDLKESMRLVGFVGIQNIIVREINESGEFVVIEGNRRLAAIRAVIFAHESPGARPPDRIDDEAKLESLRNIQVMVLETKGLTPSEIDKAISTTLGLRHYGSQLKWELLPRAKNIYDEYVKLAPGKSFEYVPKNGKRVAEVLAISASEVKRLLRGFVCYKQLCEMFQVKPHHFSLVLAGVENSNLTAYEYFKVGEKSFVLLEDTADRMDQLCEFAERDRGDFEKTIKDPKEFKRLGSILKDSKRDKSETIRDYAQGLFGEVVQREISLDDAYTELVAFKKRHQWIQATQSLIEKAKKPGNLDPCNFINEGQELKLKDDLLVLLKRYMTVIGM